MSKAKTLATTVSTGGVLDNPSAIPGANISGAVGSATNLAGGSNGTIPYQSASGTTQMLGVGTASQVLTSAGVGAPTWANPAATGVTSVAATVPSIFSITGSPITSTGTLAMTYSGTALPIANGGTGTTSTTFANLTTNVTGTLPIANGGTGTTSTTFANLTTNVTGTLPIANGGTGTTSTTFANLTTNVTGTLPIANGGTNSTATATAGGAGYGTGTAHAYTAAGTSGQVLQSNGASAPTWSTLAAGGGTVTLTSSGAITAGLGVIVNSDGTGSTPALTLAITAKTQSTVASNASANKRATMIYCDSVGVYIAFYSRTSDDYLCAKIGTVTGNGIFSWGSETVLNSAVSVRITAIWVESQSKFYLSYDDGTNGRVMCGEVTSTAITVGAQLSMFANATTQTTIAFDDTAGILVYGSTTTGSGYFNFSTINTTGLTLTANTQVASTITAGSTGRLFYWPLAGKVVYFFQLSSAALNAAIITITGVAPTIGSNQVLDANTLAPAAFAYSSLTSNLFLLANDFNAVALSGKMLSISGATITAGSVYSITDGNNTSQSSVNYVPGVNAFVISFGSKTPYKLQSLIATVAGTVITYGSATTLKSSTSNAYPYGNVYDSKYGFISNFTVVSSGADTFYAIAQTNGSGTLTSNNFLGLAKTSVSTGNSFDVSVSGSTNTAVSGLTAATLYYLNGNGQLITTPDVPVGITNTTPVKVGLALSATSLVLK